MRQVYSPDYLIIYEVTCPRCGGRHHIYGWHPKYCVHCGADIGGCSKETLGAQERCFELGVNPLTGEPVILPEAV